MATRLLLADIGTLYREQRGIDVHFRSVGGVDAARLVRDGHPFDLAVLASDAIDALIASGHLVSDSRTDVARSNVAVAVRAGAPHPAIHNAKALREALLGAHSVGYSTGPSGTALMNLLETWGIRDAMADRFVLAAPGVPVGQLVADGVVELGFQQLSELMNLPGIDVLGTMPHDCAIVTTFSAALCTGAAHPDPARDLLQVLHSAITDELKHRHGMEPA
ncbi:ABC transporter substrate-binding protein [Paraburkholderia sp. Ac-20336]|nr:MULTISPECIES: substrate-binding domain-containing protein [Burkholderiaceae]MBN3802508.1 ABC transporter substrate-binding protein [Paraburkholderia sp. Ac-20336]MBN3849378.1 ABC transporter substrate-binding protein [Paraburkholderia sp. Ac-20342]NIF53047.1 ABC transporter substrate-binding protein [Burkholderia sp. Ax-1724]NIF76240.1 ABC transporter substrate-binding protein [Paraburkholderia sp. Cy-641]